MASKRDVIKSTPSAMPSPTSVETEERIVARKPAKRPRLEDADIPTTGELSQEDQVSLSAATRAMFAREKRNKRSKAGKAGEEFDNSEHQLPKRLLAKAPKRKARLWPDGGVQEPDCTVAFPNESSLIVEDIEHLTTISLSPAEIKLRNDIIDIRSKDASDHVEDQSFIQRFKTEKRTFERFTVHRRRIVKVKFDDVDVYERGGKQKPSQCAANLAIIKELDDKVDSPPELDVEQRVVSQLWLENQGDMGDTRMDFERVSEEEIRLNSTISKAQYEILKIVERTVKGKTENPFHLARRNAYAVKYHLYQRFADFDLFIAVDRYDRVLVFEDQHAVERLLGLPVLRKLAEAFSIYTKLVRLQHPDATRHFEHEQWMEERLEFDINAPNADPRVANPGSFHAGCGCQMGDSKGKGGTFAKAAQNYAEQNEFSKAQFEKFKHGVLGAGNEILSFYFTAILGDARMETRRDGTDTFALIAILNKLMTSMHVDSSDVKEGFAGILTLGDFQGGDIVFPELGLQIEAKPGCAQLFRGGRQLHYIVPWTGPERGVLVCADGEALRVCTNENVFKTAIPAPPTVQEDERIRQQKLEGPGQSES